MCIILLVSYMVLIGCFLLGLTGSWLNLYGWTNVPILISWERMRVYNTCVCTTGITNSSRVKAWRGVAWKGRGRANLTCSKVFRTYYLWWWSFQNLLFMMTEVIGVFSWVSLSLVLCIRWSWYLICFTSMRSLDLCVSPEPNLFCFYEISGLLWKWTR
jgi:hypothetical protein